MDVDGEEVCKAEGSWCKLVRREHGACAPGAARGLGW